MDFSVAIILDIALIAVLIWSISFTIRRGFVASLLSLVGNFVALAVAWVVSKGASTFIFKTFFETNLVNKTAESLQTHGSFSLESILSNLTNILPIQFIDKILQSADVTINSNTPEIAQQLVDNIISPLILPLISVVIYFVVFLLCRVAISFFVTTLTNVNRIPLIGGVNKLLGMLLGLVSGMINVLIILCLVWGIVVITSGQLPLLNDSDLASSFFYSTFSEYNPFL